MVEFGLNEVVFSNKYVIILNYNINFKCRIVYEKNFCFIDNFDSLYVFFHF